MFVFPALKLKERKYVYRGLGFGVGLFLFGVAFCYFALMPLALVFRRKTMGRAIEEIAAQTLRNGWKQAPECGRSGAKFLRAEQSRCWMPPNAC